jgi:uncharacterized membrane protein/nitrite reductase/ring-hydroxylating ferredoxin subunit
MRSLASYKGHPLHPALIPFPFAFLTGALGFDVAAKVADHPGWAATASHLLGAGVLFALLAAVPGFLDWLRTVPPASSGRRRATQHALLNLSAVALAALAWWLRRPDPVAAGPAVLGLELVAAALLTVGGWMGGTLVNRNQIGVDHRYARAGKWREERIPRGEAGRKLRVGSPGELEVDQMKLLRIAGEEGERRLVLARIERGWVAFDDRCTHKGASLADGALVCGTVQCPWHGSQFDAVTGELRAGPAKRPIRSYRVEREGDELLLDLD